MLQQPLAPNEECPGLRSRTIVHSIVLSLLLVAPVAVQRKIIPWIIPTVGEPQ